MTKKKTTRMRCITVDIADEIRIPLRRIRIPLLHDGVRRLRALKAHLRHTILPFGNHRALSQNPHTLLAPLGGENSVPKSLVHRKTCHTMTILFRPYRERSIGREPDLQQGTFRICLNHKVRRQIPRGTPLSLLETHCPRVTLPSPLEILCSTLQSLLEGQDSVQRNRVHRKMLHTMIIHSRPYHGHLGQGLDLFSLQDEIRLVGLRVHQEEENQARNENYLSPKRNMAAYLCTHYLLLQRLRRLQDESG